MPGSLLIQDGTGNYANLTPTANDNLLAGAMLSVAALFDGSTLDLQRTPIVFKNISAVTITAATGATIWDPASGKKFRMMGYAFSVSAASSLKFYEGLTTALTTLLIQSPLIAAAGVHTFIFPGNGIPSSTADMNLNLDVSGTTPAVSGFVFGYEE